MFHHQHGPQFRMMLRMNALICSFIIVTVWQMSLFNFWYIYIYVTHQWIFFLDQQRNISGQNIPTIPEMDWNSRFLNVGQQSQLADRSNSQSPSQTDGFSFSNELAKATDSILNRAVTHSMNPVLQRLDEFRTEVNRRFDEVNQNISEFARAVDQRFASLTASRGPDFITRLAYPNAK